MHLSFQKCAEKTRQYIPGDLVPQKIIGGRDRHFGEFCVAQCEFQ